MPYTIMVIDDEAGNLKALQKMVSELWRCQTITALGGRQAVEHLLLRLEPKPCLIIVNLNMADMGAIEVIRSVRCSHKTLPIIALSPQKGSRIAMQALQAGACDVLPQPLNIEQLRFAVQALLQRMALHHEQDRLTRLNQEKIHFSDIIGVSEPLRRAVELARRVADSSIPVLIEGERGVGKEWLARAIHGSGSRAGERFLVVNCLQQHDEALDCLMQALQQESSLHASSEHGRFRAFGRGTLFLRHINGLSMEAQKSLLHSLQKMQSTSWLPIRIIASSSQSLVMAMRQGFFRKDLYDEISRFVLNVPPLRERQQDIALLAEHFIQRFAAFEGRMIYGFAPECISAIDRYRWPGNIREMAQCLHRAVLESETPWIMASHLEACIDPSRTVHQQRNLVMNLPESVSQIDFLSPEGHVRRVEDLEAELIRYAITHYKGRMTEVARRLGIGRSTLYRKIQDYQLESRQVAA